MMTRPGRPSKACSTCKSQKIRCTGERPICKRCLRLRHVCEYSSKLTVVNASSQASHHESIATIHPVSASPNHRTKDYSLGIPPPLVLDLVQLYFSNVYQASLLLHKTGFLESFAAGTACTHVVLSVCAWGAKFYRDENGQPTLQNQDSMLSWAQRAGALVFQAAESLHEDNLVTFCNLSLFWYSQGSWKVSHLHKANACQLLFINGLQPDAKQTPNTLSSEIRCRRFWACYIMHCHSSERLIVLDPIADISRLPLPWPDDEFDKGTPLSAPVTLETTSSSHGVFPHLIKALSLWSSVASFVKHPEHDLSKTIASILTIDEEISEWWRKLSSHFKLTPANIPSVSLDVLPRILLINIVYHQCLCALHASIVPLFSWSKGDANWTSVRQFSAQVAFEHSCTASQLMEALSAAVSNFSAMPSFISYAAYSGCAIQIPFLWCRNPRVREQAHANVKANIQIMKAMALYWKFAEVLSVHVQYLYKIHQKDPPSLEDEPRFANVRSFIEFTATTASTRASILEFTGLLRTGTSSYVQPGEEGNVENQGELLDDPSKQDIQPANPSSRQPDEFEAAHFRRQNQPQPLRRHESSSTVTNQQICTQSNPALDQYLQMDLFNPFIDPEMIHLTTDMAMPDLSDYLSDPFHMDGLDFDVHSAWA